MEILSQYLEKVSGQIDNVSLVVKNINIIYIMNNTSVNHLEKLSPRFHWKCKHTWKRSAKNTSWCLLGCSIGDFGTILYFQFTETLWTTVSIMLLAIFNGIISSIILETLVLSRQMILSKAFRIAIGMSLISMISMEIAMNTVDWILIGEA